LSGTFYGQSADDILAKNTEIRGGKQKLAAIKTLKYSGTFVERGLNANLALYFKSPNKVYFHVRIGDIEAKIGYDDETLWKQFPGGIPKEMPKGSDTLVVSFAEYHEFLLTHREGGFDFDLVGEENFEGTEVYKIRVTPEEGEKAYLLIDKKNYLGISFFVETPADAKDAYYFRDFRDTDGIIFPYSIKAVKANGDTTHLKFEKIECNVEIDDTLFSFPVPKSDTHAEYSYKVPEQTDVGWQTASLTKVGMKTGPMVDLMHNLLNRDDHFIHGILVAKDGKLVFEEYFSGIDVVFNEEVLEKIVTSGGDFETREMQFDKDALHFQASVTKSITSLLFGIALDKKLIRGVDEKMFSFFPEYSELCTGEKAEITIKHMLSMSSGIPWSESYPYNDSRNYLYQLVAADDPLKYVLGLNLIAHPGKAFNYNSGTTNLLGEIIRRVSKTSLADFAKNHLFNPLGITKYKMINLPNAKELFFASSGLYLRPRDMAKIGQLYLQEGMWDNKRIVSADWVEKSVEKSILLPSSNPLQYFANSYGYQWWLGVFSTKNTWAYVAAGFGDQLIVVLPKINMVIVLTGGNWDDRSPFLVYDFVINKYVLAALK
jgi:CubicO group peptidase (beta-lactamase class C family)